MRRSKAGTHAGYVLRLIDGESLHNPMMLMERIGLRPRMYLRARYLAASARTKLDGVLSASCRFSRDAARNVHRYFGPSNKDLYNDEIKAAWWSSRLNLLDNEPLPRLAENDRSLPQCC